MELRKTFILSHALQQIKTPIKHLNINTLTYFKIKLPNYILEYPNPNFEEMLIQY